MRETGGQSASSWQSRAAALLVVSGLALGPGASQAQPVQPGPSPSLEGKKPAVLVNEGGVAMSQVVALGRDLEIHGNAREGAAAIGGAARVTGRIGGDLIVLGGDAWLASSAHVGGDAFVLGGSLELEPGARVDGRMASYPEASPAWLVLLEGPALGLSPWSRQVLGAKTALLAAWLAVGLLLLATSSQALSATGREVLISPLRCFFVGLVAILAATLATLFLSAFASAVVGVPFVALVVLAALVAKLWGTVAVLLMAGGLLLHWLVRAVQRRVVEAPTGRRSMEPAVLGRQHAGSDPLYALLVGVAVLGSLKYLPGVGVAVWTATTVVGIGATLTTKFGREERWLA